MLFSIIVRSCGLLNVPRATKSNYDYVLGTTTTITGCRTGSLSGDTTYTCVEISNVSQAWSPQVTATCKRKYVIFIKLMIKWGRGFLLYWNTLTLFQSLCQVQLLVNISMIVNLYPVNMKKNKCHPFIAFFNLFSELYRHPCFIWKRNLVL